MHGQRIVALSGHKDWREIVRYTRAAGQTGLARKGMGRVADAFSGAENTQKTLIGNPSGKGLETHAFQPKNRSVVT